MYRPIFLLIVLLLVALYATHSPRIVEGFYATKDDTQTVVVYGCEKKPITPLSCPSGYVATSASMKYGRWDNNVCPDKKTVKSTTPPKFGVFQIDKQYLNKQKIDWGKATAVDLAKQKDPYHGVYKQFEITATCSKPKTK